MAPNLFGQRCQLGARRIKGKDIDRKGILGTDGLPWTVGLNRPLIDPPGDLIIPVS